MGLAESAGKENLVELDSLVALRTVAGGQVRADKKKHHDAEEQKLT